MDAGSQSRGPPYMYFSIPSRKRQEQRNHRHVSLSNKSFSTTSHLCILFFTRVSSCEVHSASDVRHRTSSNISDTFFISSACFMLFYSYIRSKNAGTSKQKVSQKHIYKDEVQLLVNRVHGSPARWGGAARAPPCSPANPSPQGPSGWVEKLPRAELSQIQA